MKKIFAILLAFAMLIPLVLIPAAAQEATTQPTTGNGSEGTELAAYLFLHYGLVILAAIGLLGISNLVRKIKQTKQAKSQE